MLNYFMLFSSHLLQQMYVLTSFSYGDSYVSLFYNEYDSVERVVDDAVFHGCTGYALE